MGEIKTRRCFDCERTLLVKDFYRDGRGYLSRKCKDCHKVQAKTWREVNTDKCQAYSKSKHLRDCYGLTAKLYNELLTLQENKCAICKQPFTDAKNTHIDHDHVTGKVRAILCSTCNVGLGAFKDNPELLRQAALYLERHKTLSPE